MNPHESPERALLDDLRRAHRLERAPADLRRRMLERFDAPVDVRKGAWSGSSRAFWETGLRVLWPGVGALAVMAVLWSGGFMVGSRSAPEPQTHDAQPLALGPEPTGTGSSVGSGQPERPCPLREAPRGAMLTAPGAQDGVTVHTFGMLTTRCGVLERRYLQYVPRVPKRPATAPVLILVHDRGTSAELLRIEDTGRHFEALAERVGLVLVYAAAAPSAATNIDVPNSGGWQTDERAHPEIQDHAYLAQILTDMNEQRVISGNNDVFLAGYGAGAAMALAAVAQRPELYAGVAAFMPSGTFATEPPGEVEARQLSRALFVLHDEPEAASGRAPLAVAEQWAIALGVPRALAQAQRMDAALEIYPGVKQLDIAAPASGGPAVRVTILDEPSRSPGFSGAAEAWAFLTGADPVNAPVIDDELDLPYDLDAAYDLDPVFQLAPDIVRASRLRPKP